MTWKWNEKNAKKSYLRAQEMNVHCKFYGYNAFYLQTKKIFFYPETFETTKLSSVYYNSATERQKNL